MTRSAPSRGALARHVLACMLGLTQLACAHTRGAPTAPEASSHASSAAHQLYLRGVSLAQEGDLTRAEEYLSSAHRSGGRDRESLVALLGVCVRASRLRSALAYAEPYLHEHPRELRLWLLVGAVQLGLGEPEHARLSVAQALLDEHAPAEAHYLMARVTTLLAARTYARAERREQTRRARAHLARYLALEPEGTHAEEVRGLLGARR